MSVPGIFPFSELPPEIQEQIDRQQMRLEEFRLGISRLFEELDEDNLRTMAQLMGQLSSMDERQASNLASFYQGICTAKLQTKFGACASCGESHDITPEQFHTQGDTQDEDKSFPDPDALRVRDVLAESEGQGPPIMPDELQPADLVLMEQYNLDDVRDEDTLRLLQFKCLGCGMIYGSIADRMKQPPGVEGCSGCQQKAKFG